MIRHIHPDSSENYEYQLGDLVFVTPDGYNKTRMGAPIPIEAIGEVVGLEPFIRGWNRYTGTYIVKSPVFYGTDKCLWHQLRPLDETIQTAEINLLGTKADPSS